MVSNPYYGHRRPEILPFLPEGFGRLLDVGCGSGQFGAMVKHEMGCEIWGVEPVARAAEQAKSRLDRVINGPFSEDAGLPTGYFDVITFNDSLEHFPYPEPPLRYCHDLLAPGGKIILSIPNMRYFENIRHILIERDFEYEHEGIRDRTHLRFFTKKSAARTISSSGYEIERIQGINPHHWSGWKIRLLDFLLGSRIEDMKWLQFVIVARPNSRSK